MYKIIDDRLGNSTELFTATQIDDYCLENDIPLVWNADHSAAYTGDSRNMNYTLLAKRQEELSV